MIIIFLLDCTKIQVPTISLFELVHKHGPALYMKIDIEGGDQFCLAALNTLKRSLLPKYVSNEIANLRIELKMLLNAGYNRFKLVDQAPFRGRGSSGGFGEFAMDFSYGLNWRTKNQMEIFLNDKSLFENSDILKYCPDRHCWFDLHSTK